MRQFDVSSSPLFTKILTHAQFNEDDRKFGPGEDTLFEAIEKPDNSNEAIQFC